MKKALITGVGGQLGTYLAEFLLEKGYEVHGTVRGSSTHVDRRVKVYWDTDYYAVLDAMDEVYNLAADSSVAASWKDPEGVGESTGLSAVRLMQCLKSRKDVRFYQASSSEMFGLARESPQTETTPLYPRSPYACAKAFAHHSTVNFRESFGLYAVSGICFNAESPRRPDTFVTRKVTKGIAAIKKGKADKLVLGNLGAKRDWGFAGDYVEAMWLTLQQPKADDYVIATGVQHSVEDFVALAFAVAGLNWQKYVVVDPSLARPAEVNAVVGNPKKIYERCGWKSKTSFEDLVKMMVRNDLNDTTKT